MVQLTVTECLVVVNAVTDMNMAVNQVAVVQLMVTKCLVVVNVVTDMNLVVNQNAQHLFAGISTDTLLSDEMEGENELTSKGGALELEQRPFHIGRQQ